MIDFFNAVLRPLEIAVAYIMVGFHSALSAIGMDPASGWTWALSIVGLVIVIRILLIPLFVKQIRASRGLQLIQPEMRKIQDKYKGRTDTASRQAMQQEMMTLYRETGTNPFSSCLPILLQSPVFFALFQVLNGIDDGRAIGALTPVLVEQADTATLFGAQISDKFIGAETLSTQILTVVLIILMSASTFTTQRQLMMKNMPAAALDNPFAQQQKILLYVLPLIFAVSGVNFPIGVLIYWLTTNVWSMGQQFYVIRRMPAPGSPAEKALRERRARKGKGLPEEGDGSVATDGGAATGGPAGGQRQQPKRQPKRKRGPAYGTPTAGGPAPGKGSDDERAVGDPGADGQGSDGEGPGAETSAGGASSSGGTSGSSSAARDGAASNGTNGVARPKQAGGGPGQPKRTGKRPGRAPRPKR